MTKINNKFPLRTQKARSTKQRILNAATKLFLANGYSQTSLDKVAAEAETTKPTVYSHFKSKEGLFYAVFEQRAKEKIFVFQELLIPTSNPEADLTRFGDELMSAIFSLEQNLWERLTVAESIRHPEIGEAFYKTGPALVIQQLTEYFAKQTKANLLKIENPLRAAEQLMGLMLGMDRVRTQIGKKPPEESVLKTQCREAVRVFLAMYGK